MRDEAGGDGVNGDGAKGRVVAALDEFLVHGVLSDHHALGDGRFVLGELRKHGRIVLAHGLAAALHVVGPLADNLDVGGETRDKRVDVLPVVSLELAGDDRFDGERGGIHGV